MVNEQVNIQIKAQANDALNKVRWLRTSLGQLQAMTQQKPINIISQSAFPQLQEYKRALEWAGRETGRNARIADAAQRSFERLAYKMQETGKVDSAQIDRFRGSMERLQSKFQTTEMSAQEFRMQMDRLKTDMRITQQFERAGQSADNFANKLSLKWVDTSVINNFKSKVAESQASFLRGKSSVEQFKNSIKEYKAEARAASKDQTAFNTSLGKIGSTISMALGKFYAIISVIKTFTRQIGKAITANLEFTGSFLNVSRRLDASEEEMGALEDKLRELATQSRFTYSELTKVAEEAARLGLGAEWVYEFTAAMEEFLLIADADPAQATLSFGQLLNVAGRWADELKSMTEAVVRLGSEYATSEDEIIGFTKRLAAVGDASWITIEEIMGMGAALTEMGVKSERWWTAVMRTLLAMEDVIRSGGEDAEKLGEITGQSVEEMTKAVENNQTMRVYEDLFRVMGEAQEQWDSLIPIFTELFGVNNRTIESVIDLSSNYDALKEGMAMANNEAENAEYVQGKVDEQNESSIANVQRLKSSWKDLQAQIWEILEFPLQITVDFIQILVESLSVLAGLVKDLQTFGFDSMVFLLEETARWSGKAAEQIGKMTNAIDERGKLPFNIEDTTDGIREFVGSLMESETTVDDVTSSYINHQKELINTADSVSDLSKVEQTLLSDLKDLSDANQKNSEEYKSLEYLLAELYNTSKDYVDETKQSVEWSERLASAQKYLADNALTSQDVFDRFNGILSKFNINLSKGQWLIDGWLNRLGNIQSAIADKINRDARDNIFGELFDDLSQDITEDNFVTEAVENLWLQEYKLRESKKNIESDLEDLKERLLSKEEWYDDPMWLQTVADSIEEKQSELENVNKSLKQYEGSIEWAGKETQTFAEKVMEAKKELEEFDAEQEDMIRMVKDLVKYEGMTIDEAVRTYKTLNNQLELSREQREKNQEQLEEEREDFRETLQNKGEDIEEFRDSVQEAYEWLEKFNKDITSDIRDIGWEIRDVTKDMSNLKQEALDDINDIQDELSLDIEELEEWWQEDIAQLYLDKQEEIKEKEEEYQEVLKDKEKNLEDTVSVLEEQKKLEEELAEIKKNVDEDILDRVIEEDELSEIEKIQKSIAEERKKLEEEAKQKVQEVKEEKKEQLKEYQNEINMLKEQREIADAIRSGRMVSIEATDDDIIGKFKTINEEWETVTKEIQNRENKLYAQKQKNARDDVYNQIEEFENWYEDILEALQTNIEDRKLAEEWYTEFVEEEREKRQKKIDKYTQALNKLQNYWGVDDLAQDLWIDKRIEPIPEMATPEISPRERPVSISVGEINEEVWLDSFVRTVTSRVK